MNKTLFLCALVLVIAGCSKDDIFSPDNNIPPTTPGKTAVLKLNTTIENVISTRSITKTFKETDSIGVFYNDTCINRKLTFDGKMWQGNNIVVDSEPKSVYAYYPYDNTNISTAVAIDINSQRDLLYGSGEVGESCPTATIVMKHALALVRVKLLKGNYIGNGHVKSLVWNDIYSTATCNIENGEITSIEKTSYQAGGNYDLIDNDTVIVETIMIPVKKATGISLTLSVDGEQRTYPIPESHIWEAGKEYTYTLTLTGGYNSPIDLEEDQINVSYWNTLGKTDKIVLGTSDVDWFNIAPENNFRGEVLYRNEGRAFGFFGYWTGYDSATGEMPDTWEGEYRVVLMDATGNIVEQFQPKSITATNGAMMKNTGIRCYISAPTGKYEFGVLFRKKGDTTWIKASRLDGVTANDMSYTVKDETQLPALRLIQLEEEENTGVVILNRAYNTSFNITYNLSNRANIALKGRIKAVWERTFSNTGNCWRPSQKRSGGTNDTEWQDEIGSVDIDIAPSVRFWRGKISCQFSTERNEPKDKAGTPYCTPVVHLYFIPEGSTEWILLRQDMDPVLAKTTTTTAEENSVIYLTYNYLLLEPSTWHN